MGVVKLMRVRTLIVVLFIVFPLFSVVTPIGSESPLSVKRSSSAIAITPDGTTLLVVNPDSNSLTLVDTATLRKIAEIPVGVGPRTVAVDGEGRRAYVSNRGSDTISVVDLSAHQVVHEITVGVRPYGVVVNPQGDRIYVAVQGEDRVRILDADTLDTLALLSTPDRPSGLAISDDGRVLYITHLLSNVITILEDVSSDSPRIQVSSLLLWPDSNLVQSIVIGPEGKRAYVPHTRSNSSNRALTFDSTVFPLVSLIDLTTQHHLVGQQIDLGTLDPPGVGLPFDAVVTPDGKEIWVLNAASNDISVIDLSSYQLIAHIEAGDNPRGIVLSPDGTTAYVNNTLAGTVSVIDVPTHTVTAIIPVTEIPLPPILLRGKRLFFSSDDERMSKSQWISCNTCHFEGEQDGRTWFFGFAGPRNTTSLLGMVETYPLRWSGEWDESADSEFAVRKESFGTGLIEGEMHCALSPVDCSDQPPNQGRSDDLDALAAFIDSLQMPLSPSHAHGEPLTEAERRGRAIFSNPDLGCIECHPPPLYTDHKKHDVGTATPDERIGPKFDTPTLRGLYDSAPYFHDGSAATLYEALTRPSPKGEHDVRSLLSEAEIRDLIAFLLALPYEK